MEIFIRVDASISIGTGHVIRCMNLAEILAQNGMVCSFITKAHAGNLIHKLEDKNYKVYNINTRADVQQEYTDIESEWLGSSQQEDAFSTIESINKQTSSPSAFIIDHYALSSEWEKIIKHEYPSALIIVIDDLCNRNHTCDLLIDTTIDRQRLDYAHLIPKECITLLGTKYSLLKFEFEKLRKKAQILRSNTTKPESILITMGGIDALNVTSKILRVINRIIAKDLKKITVVLGGNCPHIAEVCDLAYKMNCKTDVLVDTNDMSNLMLIHDASIGALGGTTWERCVLGLPTINIAIAKNQKTIIDKLNRRGFIALDNIDFSDKDILSAWLLLEKDYIDLSLKSFALCDGLGMDRVVSQIKSIFHGRGNGND